MSEVGKTDNLTKELQVLSVELDDMTRRLAGVIAADKRVYNLDEKSMQIPMAASNAMYQMLSVQETIARVGVWKNRDA